VLVLAVDQVAINRFFTQAADDVQQIPEDE